MCYPAHSKLGCDKSPIRIAEARGDVSDTQALIGKGGEGFELIKRVHG